MGCLQRWQGHYYRQEILMTEHDPETLQMLSKRRALKGNKIYLGTGSSSTPQRKHATSSFYRDGIVIITVNRAASQFMAYETFSMTIQNCNGFETDARYFKDTFKKTNVTKHREADQCIGCTLPVYGDKDVSLRLNSILNQEALEAPVGCLCCTKRLT